ncbi:hypothetical protein A9R05_42875 (plasmid) [Burkholderia sp. KK1]|uniref:hypothetical protein n=1 Tax=Burkholderia sp. M701 TaxID=326454 RepID=UPI0009799D01|nr:hypothetical protein [Burkholderia sp. M701]AQH05764.1 hypothetical protein A9R05_42875 [Burkholderia sp. KK1]
MTTPAILKNSLLRVTFTGADDHTDIEALFELGMRYPGQIEFGILYSLTQMGVGRYPSKEWIGRLLQRLAGRSDAEKEGIRFSLHVCGRAVADMVTNRAVPIALLEQFDRVQLNFRSDGYDIEDIRHFVSRMDALGIEVITQHNSANADLWSHLVAEKNHAVLFDESGGRGVERSSWHDPLPDIFCGYAGGLGPDNVYRCLDEIQKTAGRRSYWIDMEGKLRNEHDQFDLSRVQAVMAQVVRWESDVHNAQLQSSQAARDGVASDASVSVSAALEFHRLMSLIERVGMDAGDLNIARRIDRDLVARVRAVPAFREAVDAALQNARSRLSAVILDAQTTIGACEMLLFVGGSQTSSSVTPE